MVTDQGGRWKLFPAYVIGCSLAEVSTLRPFLRRSPYKAWHCLSQAVRFDIVQGRNS
jgi:hypothetical protein